MKRWLGGMLLCALALRCATGEDDTNRKKPGGYDDAGKDAAGSGGTAGNAGTGGSSGGGTDAGNDAGDAAPDVAIDATNDVTDGTAGSVGDAADGAFDAIEAGPTGRLLLIARSDTELTFGETTGAGWTTKNVSRATSSTPAIATTTSGAIAVVRDQANNALAWAAWDPTSGAWSAFSQVAAGGMTIASPALAATSSEAHLAFLGTDSKFYSNSYAPSAGWQATYTKVEAAGIQSFGPSAPALAASSSALTLAQEGQDGDLYTQLWQGSWQSAVGHGLSVKIKPLTPPAATFRETGGKAIVSYVETGTGRLMWTEGWAGAWTSPIPVHPDAYSSGSPALATLSNGDVVLAYGALDGKLYATLLSGQSFGAPALVHPSFSTTSTPAVAPGVGGHIAELAWVSGGSVQHSSLGQSGWSGPTAVVAGAHKAVALTSWLK